MITEEFLLSILRFPHLIVLPAKTCAFLLDKPFIAWNNFYTSKIETRYTHFVTNIREKLVPRSQISFDKYNENKIDFWQVQQNLFIQIMTFYYDILTMIQWTLTSVFLLLMKTLSGGAYIGYYRGSTGTAVYNNNATRPSMYLFWQLLQFVVGVPVVLAMVALILYPGYFVYNNWD